MKKLISFGLVFVLLCTFVAAGGSAENAADAPIRITLSDIDSSETVPGRSSQRVAQLVVMPVAFTNFVEADELSETSRGAGGFGSTGK